MGELNRSTPIDESIGAGATVTVEVGASEQAVMVIFWTLVTGTPADIGDTEVRAVDPDGNVNVTPLTPEVISAAAVAGPVCSEVHRYDVRGLSKVELSFENASGGALDGKVFVNHYWE